MKGVTLSLALYNVNKICFVFIEDRLLSTVENNVAKSSNNFYPQNEYKVSWVLIFGLEKVGK